MKSRTGGSTIPYFPRGPGEWQGAPCRGRSFLLVQKGTERHAQGVATGSTPGQRAALRSQDGHPLRTPIYGGCQIGGLGGDPFGAEVIRTRGPLSPLPLSVWVLRGGWDPCFVRLGVVWCSRVRVGRVPGMRWLA